jgi:predicted dehydrogenase
MTVHCLVIGAGKMGSAHLHALAALEPDALACWAPSDRERLAAKSVGARFFHGTLNAALDNFQPTHVVIASPVETLTPISLQIIEAGVRHLLVEKPVVLNPAQARELAAAVEKSGVELYAGYNRRFYASILTALKLIGEAGEEIESVIFEFNEAISELLGPRGHDTSVRQRWLVANSLHVIDAALHPIGYPIQSQSFFHRSGKLVWHPAGSLFVGAGITVKGKAFSYHGNWAAPGYWGIEWVTKSARFRFRPLERLSMLRAGSLDWEEVSLVNDLDQRFKPGVYLQDKAFLCGEDRHKLVPLEQALELFELGTAIAGYT